MYEIGTICIKLAGRDAGREAVIVDILDDNYVLIDGNVRRKKCNIMHLEPSSKKIKIKKNASHEEVKAEFEKLKLTVWETKPKKAAEKPKKQKREKKAAETTKESEKTVKKKAAKKTEQQVKEAEIVEEKKIETKKVVEKKSIKKE